MNGASKLYLYLRSWGFALSMQVIRNHAVTQLTQPLLLAEKKIYEANDKAYQQLIMSCTGIAFGLVTQAKTA